MTPERLEALREDIQNQAVGWERDLLAYIDELHTTIAALKARAAIQEGE